MYNTFCFEKQNNFFFWKAKRFKSKKKEKKGNVCKQKFVCKQKLEKQNTFCFKKQNTFDFDFHFHFIFCFCFCFHFHFHFCFCFCFDFDFDFRYEMNALGFRKKCPNSRKCEHKHCVTTAKPIIKLFHFANIPKGLVLCINENARGSLTYDPWHTLSGCQTPPPLSDSPPPPRITLHKFLTVYLRKWWCYREVCTHGATFGELFAIIFTLSSAMTICLSLFSQLLLSLAPRMLSDHPEQQWSWK